jgi:hypothetical protein
MMMMTFKHLYAGFEEEKNNSHNWHYLFFQGSTYGMDCIAGKL